MSARAAARLERLGLTVYRYQAGKADWFAAGLPRAGHDAGIPRLADVATRDVPTARLEARVGDVRDRAAVDAGEPLAEGEKIPRKGGPGITRSNLLVINRIDLAPHVGADLGVMERDATRQRAGRPFVFTNLRSGEGVDAIVEWLRQDLLLATPA